MASRRRQTSSLRTDLFRLAFIIAILLCLLAVRNDWLGARGVYDDVTGAYGRWMAEFVTRSFTDPPPSPAVTPPGG